MNYCVITTINPPTAAVKVLSSTFDKNLIVVGDEKTPLAWEYENVTYINKGEKLYAPLNHYARKNMGYMKAISSGATLIYDTDDDNIPNQNWIFRELHTPTRKIFRKGWVNAYKLFSKEFIWPRGFPLKYIKEVNHYPTEDTVMDCPIQQGLSNGEPDVDAIFRLVFNKEISFEEKGSVTLTSGAWCPFNSQSTWWFPSCFVLLYLPVTVSFRMTDIWRSFVAQRCLWELGMGVTFHSPSEVFQKRNPHNFMNDFTLEVDGYLKNEEIAEILSSLTLGSDMSENLFACYKALHENGIVKDGELESLQEWINDYKSITQN